MRTTEGFALSDDRIPEGTPIYVEEWDGPYARVCYRSELRGRPSAKYALVRRETAQRLLRVGIQSRHRDFQRQVARQAGADHLAYIAAQRGHVASTGHSRAPRTSGTHRRGSRRSTGSRSPPGGDDDPGGDGGDDDPDELGRTCGTCGEPCRPTERTCARCRSRRSRARRRAARPSRPVWPSSGVEPMPVLALLMADPPHGALTEAVAV